MAEYYENRIVLSAEESEVFRQRMDHPDREAVRRRDMHLSWIEEHMEIQVTPTGFIVTVPDTDMTNEIVTVDSYYCAVKTELMQPVSIIMDHPGSKRRTAFWEGPPPLRYVCSRFDEKTVDFNYENQENTYSPFGEEKCA